MAKKRKKKFSEMNAIEQIRERQRRMSRGDARALHRKPKKKKKKKKDKQ